MRLVLAAALVLVLAPPAFAAMAPEHYEAARRDAADVIVIAVTEVGPPSGAGFGTCMVSGTVLRVERGTRYALDAPVRLAVDCADPASDYPDGGAIYQRIETLAVAPYGRAWLGPDGEIVLSQYEQLSAAD